ncbi:MAG TPA: CPBP family intramembrane glutamic endopeptidase [Mycobacteriales bacterium]|nr:CPBP family intramembrane glutamic endopeptidase [Mycobacteriales bacterium]
MTEAAPALPRRWLVTELWLVFALSLGAAGVRAAIDLIADVSSGQSLTSQVASLNSSQAPGRPWFDLFLQLDSLIVGVVPVFLVIHFLTRSAERPAMLGIDLSRVGSDLVRGAGLAAVVGGAGLGLYLATHAAGVDLTVVAESLPVVWWRIPVLLLSALQNAALEEVLVAGYLLHRLRQLGWSDNKALITSALLRGSYHLYQGLGGFAGNAVMGLIFGRLYQRWGRVMPLLIAHTLMDAVAFVGYAELAGHVSWLPTPNG